MMRGAVVLCVMAVLCLERSQIVHGTWTAWSAYGSCSVTCGTGTQTRTRSCSAGSCSGDSTETTSCYEGTCYPSVLGNLERNCSWTYFGCYSGSMTCIDFSFRCDGNSDCDDGSDESVSIAGCQASCNNGAGDKSLSSFLVASVAALLFARYTLMKTRD